MSDRLDDLERRVAALEQARSAASDVEPPPGDDDTFALLAALEQRAPGGAAAVVGSVPRGDGVVRWQYALTASHLTELDWSERADVLAALGSPVRLRLLQLIEAGVDSSAALAARDDLGTTGQVHHHLRALVAAGWLESAARGRYRIPSARLVPLLAILVASTR